MLRKTKSAKKFTRTMMHTLGLSCCGLMLNGCSYSGAYQGIKHSNEIECRKLPSSEYEDCMKSLDKDYDDYREQREAVIKDRY